MSMKEPLILRFHELDSTNEYVKKHMITLPDKAIVIADIQSNGRGRNQHSWVSGNPDNLYFSFHLKIPSPNQSHFCTLTHFLSLVAAKVLDISLQGTPWVVHIKWPNDLMIAGYKIGGVLAETTWMNHAMTGIALGIGINISLGEDEKERIDQPASDLKSYSRTNLDKETIFQNIVHSFLDQVDQYLVEGFPSIRKAYEEKLILNKENCQYRLQDDGSLLILEKGKEPYCALNPFEGDDRRTIHGEE